jgi:hypothetical protein
MAQTAEQTEVQRLRDVVAEADGTVTWTGNGPLVQVTVRIGADTFTAEAAAATAAARTVLATMRQVLG